MHIDKYLCDVKRPNFLPGPFSIRLKYELRQTIFEKKVNHTLHYVYATAVLCLLILCTIFVSKPQTAERLNILVFGDKTQSLDMLVLTDRNIDLSNFPTHVKTVSSDMNTALPFIEENKSYLIHKFKNHEDKVLFYISEVKQNRNPNNLF